MKLADLYKPSAESEACRVREAISGVLSADLPELEETDNLHAAVGPLRYAQDLLAQLYGAQRSWFLVNGSSSGLLAALFACVDRFRHTRTNNGVKPVIIACENCHKSVHDAVSLMCGAVELYLIPLAKLSTPT